MKDRKIVAADSNEDVQIEQRYKDVVLYIDSMEQRLKSMEAALFRHGIRV